MGVGMGVVGTGASEVAWGVTELDHMGVCTEEEGVCMVAECMEGVLLDRGSLAQMQTAATTVFSDKLRKTADRHFSQLRVLSRRLAQSA